jgi:hypothetical protein
VEVGDKFVLFDSENIHFVSRIHGTLNLIYKNLIHILDIIIVCAPEAVDTRCHHEVNERYFISIYFARTASGD